MGMTFMTLVPIPIPTSRGGSFVLDRVVVANAHSPDKSMSSQIYCLKFSYEIGPHCKRGGDNRAIKHFFCARG